jgi:uncharacterized protein YijF (DUF1287 family)
MLFWQDEKDALKQELFAINSKIRNLQSMYNHLQSTVHEQAGFKFANHPRTYGLKKDGTPKAKPGRKPK